MRQRVAQGDSVEAGRAAIDKWRRDGAGGLLHAHVRLMGSGAVAVAAAVPNEGGGRGRGVRVPYRLQAQARALAAAGEAGEAGEAQDERVIYNTAVHKTKPTPSTCSYAVSPSSIPPPDWGQRYIGGEGTGDPWTEPHLGSSRALQLQMQMQTAGAAGVV